MKSLIEVDGKIKSHWYIVCLSEELKHQKPLRRIVYDQALVVFKSLSGKISVLEDRCAHRAAQLSLGKVEGENLRCPYHGWSYNLNGVVSEIPSEGPDQKDRSWCIRKYISHEQDGCVWVWMGTEEPQDATPPWRFPEYGNSHYANYFMITDFPNEVTHLVQNFMDVPHTVFVHDKWFRRRRLLEVPIKLEVKNGQVKVTYEQSRDSIGFMERILNPQKSPMIHTDEFIFPNLTRVDYFLGNTHFIINSQCTPVSRYETRVFTWISYRLGRLTHLAKPFMRFYTRQVIQQDVEIMQNHGSNLRQLESASGPQEFTPNKGYYSTAADELHLAIEKMRSQGVSDPLQAFTANYSKERSFWI